MELHSPSRELRERRQTDRIHGAPITNELRGLRARLVEQINPEAKRIRRELFGGDAPPFSSIADAASWIERSAMAQSETAVKKVGRLFDDALIACHELEPFVGHEVRAHVLPFLSYPVASFRDGTATRQSRSVRFARSSPLGRLKRMVAGVSYVTAFSEVELVGYVLTGRAPFLSPYELTFEQRTARFDGGSTLSRIAFLIELRVADLSTQDWNEVLQIARMALRPQKTV